MKFITKSIVLLTLVFVFGCRAKPPKSTTDATAADSSADSAATESKRPLKFRDYNLVFVSFDALQAAHVGSYGYDRNVTPTIDSFAKKGFQFRNNTSVASWTVPASMSWFTGVYPSEHRMVNKYAIYQPPQKKIANLKELSPSLITLADILKSNGYATGGFTGNAGVSGGFGYEQGFDEYYYEKGKFGRLNQSAPRAIEWLKKHKDEKFFLFLHGYDVHGQSIPPQGYDYRFVADDYDRRFTGDPREQETLREEGLERGEVELREADVAFWRAIYDEKIQRADARFRKFVDEFTKMGLAEKTVFVLTSDHGTELHEHRRFDHGFTLYQELIHTPLIIALPGEASRQIEDRVSSIDIMPTILDLLDIELSNEVKTQLRGDSLTNLMRGETVAKDIISETNYREYTYKRAIISPDQWKLIYTLEDRSRELYNLNADPHERKDLASEETAKADALQDRLFAHYRAIGHDVTARQWVTGLNPVYPSQGID